ncbi:pickpocket protein 11-like [Hyposmocoma kahamanoa]|uniref:pickpocket protein 11-like n=1 Tax=Hyposmocoma kahamanoa TaxID=1477025 RepID=UPI000E6D699F|nr:pickpocket protein 11-like [Hyposmocoma kahamanoa]
MLSRLYIRRWMKKLPDSTPGSIYLGNKFVFRVVPRRFLLLFSKMFFQRTLKVQHQSPKRYIPHQPPNQRPVKDFIKDKVKSYIVLFLETSSIHGLNHLIAPGRHWFEIFLWMTCLCLSVFGSVYLSSSTWTRYQYSPTVISMDRDMFAWNTTFPCVTICPLNKIDTGKLESYLESTSQPDKEALSNFIYKLANATYQNFEDVPQYDGIDPTAYTDLLLQLSRPFKPTLTIGASGITLNIMPTITEMGLCYTINSKMAFYNSPEYRAENRWDIVKTYNDTFFVHPLDGEVFAQVINLSNKYDVYIHGPLEVPDISTKCEHSDEDFYMKLYVTALSVYTSPEAAKLSINQRRCRFFNENNLPHNSVYTYNMCRDEKVCNVKDLHCLSKYKDELYQLADKTGKKLNCGCFPNCDDVNYVIQSSVLQEWFLGTNLQWGIVTYPRMRYRRDIIFGFTDVLVAVGGMAGLFLGCSVLSFMEIVYFLTLRLICYTHYQIKK